ncbi:hypothetical protein OQA88_12255 [Cercophora sp. LCS_1]
MQTAPPTICVTDNETQMPTPKQSPSMEKWEEPHPGQRFPLSPVGDAGCAGEHHLTTPGLQYQLLEESTDRDFADTSTPRSGTASTAPMLKRPASIEFVPTAMQMDFGETTDTDGVSRPISCAIETMASSELSSPRLSMTDFSNHLNITFSGEFEAVAVLPSPVSEEYQPTSNPDEDPYGWEAELDKKISCSSVEFRRTGSAKRSLLHRVFSIGPKGVS